MSIAELLPTKITPTHQAKLAYIYIRQSSLSQVLRHTASTDLQYHLIERACALGWPRDRVVVIDEDLGKSGASAEQRSGFQRLLAEIGLARVGLVTSLDASRLARNNRDWYQLLELCAMFGALIADSEQLYDPRLYHDRLLLGLSGMMSEAELHHIKLRLQAGEWHKAERGELRVPLPVGLVRQRDGAVTLDPDEEIQGRLRLLFEKFATFGSAYQVLRYLHQAELPLPARPTLGPAPHEIVWHPATASRIFAILHNPAYAGAYVYGRKKIDPTRRKAGRPGSGSVRRPLNEWPVCLQGIYPAYISWDQFLANQERLRDNQNRYEHALHGVPRKGRALFCYRDWLCVDAVAHVCAYVTLALRESIRSTNVPMTISIVHNLAVRKCARSASMRRLNNSSWPRWLPTGWHSRWKPLPKPNAKRKTSNPNGAYAESARSMKPNEPRGSISKWSPRIGSSRGTWNGSGKKNSGRATISSTLINAGLPVIR